MTAWQQQLLHNGKIRKLLFRKKYILLIHFVYIFFHEIVSENTVRVANFLCTSLLDGWIKIFNKNSPCCQSGLPLWVLFYTRQIIQKVWEFHISSSQMKIYQRA